MRTVKKMAKKITCYVCGKSSIVEGTNKYFNYMCPECRGDKSKQLNRIFTKDTVFLVCKWYNEGMTIPKIAEVLKRSPHNVRLALEQGGVKIK